MDQPIQEAISRMSTFQMAIKTLTVAITSTNVFIFGATWFNIALVLVILIVLWILDAYYLSLERNLRKKTNDFGFRKLREKETTINNILKKSVLPFHATFIVVTILTLINSIHKLV